MSGVSASDALSLCDGSGGDFHDKWESAAGVCTIFKEETGETFTEVLIRTRMEKAKELLENTTMKNYEIAEKVGFSDPHYFGISFKKMTGYTPTEYAREKRR